MNQIYLAGPISGLTLEQVTTWRTAAKNLLSDFEVLDPARDIETLVSTDGTFSPNFDESHALADRDFDEVRSCDAVLANLLEAEHVSIGTCFELAWAYALKIPTFVVLPKDGGPHNHTFIRHFSVAVFSLEDAAKLLRILASCW